MIVDLEKQLERFKETAEKNPDLFKEVESFPSGKRIRKLINRFLGEAKNRKVKDDICELIYRLALDHPRCYRTDPNFKINTLVEFYSGLKSTTWLSRLSILPYLSEIGFKRGFSNEAKKFVANVYKIVYDAYLKEDVERDKRKDSLGSDYLL